jgi:hypothetical protein
MIPDKLKGGRGRPEVAFINIFSKNLEELLRWGPHEIFLLSLLAKE